VCDHGIGMANKNPAGEQKAGAVWANGKYNPLKGHS
jgi:hypothetical protein